jgi:hypothetical protein
MEEENKELRRLLAVQEAEAQRRWRELQKLKLAFVAATAHGEQPRPRHNAEQEQNVRWFAEETRAAHAETARLRAELIIQRSASPQRLAAPLHVHAQERALVAARREADVLAAQLRNRDEEVERLRCDLVDLRCRYSSAEAQESPLRAFRFQRKDQRPAPREGGGAGGVPYAAGRPADIWADAPSLPVATGSASASVHPPLPAHTAAVSTQTGRPVEDAALQANFVTDAAVQTAPDARPVTASSLPAASRARRLAATDFADEPRRERSDARTRVAPHHAREGDVGGLAVPVSLARHLRAPKELPAVLLLPATQGNHEHRSHANGPASYEPHFRARSPSATWWLAILADVERVTTATATVQNY